MPIRVGSVTGNSPGTALTIGTQVPMRRVRSATLGALSRKLFPVDTFAFIRKYRRLMAVGLFLLTLFVIFELSGLRENFSLDYVRGILAENPWSGGILFVLLFCVGNLLQIPGWVFLAAAVLTLGNLYGGLLTYVASVISCLIIYGLIRALGGDALRELDSKLARKIFRYLDAYPLLSIIALRTFFQTAPPLNYSLALSGVQFRYYVIGTIVGLPIPIAIYCLAFEFLFRGIQ